MAEALIIGLFVPTKLLFLIYHLVYISATSNPLYPIYLPVDSLACRKPPNMTANITDRSRLRMERLRMEELEQQRWEQEALVMPEVRTYLLS